MLSIQVQRLLSYWVDKIGGYAKNTAVAFTESNKLVQMVMYGYES